MEWLVGWKRRKKITITGSPGAGTNYQVLLKVGESSDTTGCDFNVEGHSTNFPSDTNQSGDLRFTSSDGTTPLSFWVEKVEDTSPNRTAYVWVKVADSLDSDVDIYCYYRNVNATNASNRDNVFLFFDDFDVDTIGTEWFEVCGDWIIGEGKLYVNSTYGEYPGNIIRSNHLLNSNVRVEMKTTIPVLSSLQTDVSLITVPGNGYVGAERIGVSSIGPSYTNKWEWAKANSSWTIDGGEDAGVVMGETYIFQMDYVDGIATIRLLETGTYYTHSLTGNWLGIHIGATVGSGFGVDWIRVRKYIDPEPLFSLAGNEERSSKLTGSACDKSGNVITGESVKVFILDKETGEKIGQTTSDSNGNWSCDVWITPSTKVVTVLTLEGEYGGDTDIAGAEFDITEGS